MNDLMRPALYEAWHDILPVTPAFRRNWSHDIVGPVCESGDFSARIVPWPSPWGPARRHVAGASRHGDEPTIIPGPRAAEVMVDGDQTHLPAAVNRSSELFAGETVLPRWKALAGLARAPGL